MTSGRDLKVLGEVAEFLRARGIPCGVWSVPAPYEINDAQMAFDRELERIIADMMVEVPVRLAASDNADAELQAMIDRGETPF